MSSDHDDQHDDDHRVITDRVPAGVWLVEPGSSQINIRARSLFSLVPVNGFFEHFGGELRVDAEGVARGELNVQASSFRTGIDARDARLRSAEFFAVGEFPLISFEASSISPLARPEMRISEEERMTVEGQLRIQEAIIPLSFPATFIAHGDHLHVEGKVRIDHRAAGLGWTRPGLIGKSVRADIALTLKPAP